MQFLYTNRKPFDLTINVMILLCVSPIVWIRIAKISKQTLSKYTTHIFWRCHFSPKNFTREYFLTHFWLLFSFGCHFTVLSCACVMLLSFDRAKDCATPVGFGVLVKIVCDCRGFFVPSYIISAFFFFKACSKNYLKEARTFIWCGFLHCRPDNFFFLVHSLVCYNNWPWIYAQNWEFRFFSSSRDFPSVAKFVHRITTGKSIFPFHLCAFPRKSADSPVFFCSVLSRPIRAASETAKWILIALCISFDLSRNQNNSTVV